MCILQKENAMKDLQENLNERKVEIEKITTLKGENSQLLNTLQERIKEAQVNFHEL